MKGLSLGLFSSPTAAPPADAAGGPGLVCPAQVGAVLRAGVPGFAQPALGHLERDGEETHDITEGPLTSFPWSLLLARR